MPAGAGAAATLEAQLVVLAKSPVAGRVKTRLTPSYTPAEAAALARASLHDTLRAAAAAPVRRRVLALDGARGDWLLPGFAVVAQRGTGLDARIANAVTDAWAGRRLPLLLVGMDTPALTARLLADAVRELLAPGVDAVLGPAYDGGFWALGLRRPRPDLLLGVPMSTERTGVAQLARLRDGGVGVRLLPVLRDVDTAADAAAVAGEAPYGEFAATLTAIDEGAA